MSEGDLFVMEKGVTYPCKIVKRRKGEVLVHFTKFSDRHDVWLDENSDRFVTKNTGKKQSVQQKLGEVPLSASVAASHTRTGRMSICEDPEVIANESLIDEKCDELERYEDAEDVLEDPRRPAPQSAVPLSADVVIRGTGINLSSPGGDNPDVRRRGGCSFCGLLLESRFVSCSDCSMQYHAEVTCLGLEENAIEVLVGCVDGAVCYRCCACRCSNSMKVGGNPADAEVCMKQVLSVVGGISGSGS